MSRTHVRGAEPVEIAPHDHLPGRLQSHAEAEPDREILAYPSDSGWNGLTRGDVAERVDAITAGCIARGVRPGDRVALMSPTRYEWTLTDLAIMTAGAVTVPLYDTSSPDQCRDILRDAEPTLAVASDGDLAGRLGEAADVDTIVIDYGGLDELADSASDDDRKTVDQRRSELTLDAMATIVYTSGTTGAPKGCVLTHRNLAWTTRQTQKHLEEVLRGEASLLQFLPLAHIFARLIQFVCLDAGVRVGYARSLDDIREDLGTFRPTLMLGVPRVFEKFLETASKQATGIRRPLFSFAVDTGETWSVEGNPPWRSARRAIADVLVYRKLRDALGGRIRYCVSGGAPLKKDLARLFAAAKMPVMEGYGLTETTAPAAANTPAANRIGTVGRPLPGVEIKLDDGKVLIKGGNVFQGYFRNEERTAEDFDGDWFRTGDLGALDDDGFLSLSDRKKELIVTSSGKNVAPTPLEDAVSSNELVAQTMLVGNERKFVAALVTLDDDRLRSFAEERGIDGDLDDLRDDEDVRDEIQKAVDRANESVSQAESIREFVILDRQFTEDEGELTPTLKLRRSDIAEHFADEIESIYT